VLSFVQGERLVGALSSIKARAPVTGGNFGVWGGMFSTFDCAVKGYRQKEDAWNGIISGFMTGGCLALRSTSLLAGFNCAFTHYIQ
jgi:import inner membrane translocase subunit TIM17